MPITTDSEGFTSAKLYGSSGGAELHAAYREGDFKVVTDADHMAGVDGWHFDEEDCREAAVFFIKLADELKRRNNNANS
jgi:hypothetical protein